MLVWPKQDKDKALWGKETQAQGVVTSIQNLKNIFRMTMLMILLTSHLIHSLESKLLLIQQEFFLLTQVCDSHSKLMVLFSILTQFKLVLEDLAKLTYKISLAKFTRIWVLK